MGENYISNALPATQVHGRCASPRLHRGRQMGRNDYRSREIIAAA